MARGYQESSWLVAAAAVIVAGCALSHTRVYLPEPALKSDSTLGYQTEQDRHDIRLYVGKPEMVEHWREDAFPFGQIRHSKWKTGPYPFTSHEWFPFGIPTVKGEHCALQTYNGVKIEGGKYKEFQANGWPYVPLEFHEVEQNAFRVKCDLDVQPSVYNQAGY